MTDIHSHLIFNVDDGASSIDESISLLKMMKNEGFNNVIITPHFILGTEYSSGNKLKLRRLNEIKDRLLEENIDINIYLGNEIFINESIISLIEDGEIYPINGGKYLLIEFPFHNKINNLEDILYEITCKGYTPIIAHPERYTYFQKDYKLVDSLKEEGYLFQCNYSSILGYYGKDSEKLFKYMLKHHYVDYLGTDLHNMKRTYVLDNFSKIIKNIKKICKEDYYNEIINNCDNLVK